MAIHLRQWILANCSGAQIWFWELVLLGSQFPLTPVLSLGERAVRGNGTLEIQRVPKKRSAPVQV
jgi:hypothetical protein